MELRHLRYFIAVAERQNVTRAADDLHMAQQALSVSIKQLESELGYDLFERVAGRIRLTSAGIAFAGEARTVLAATERAVERGRRAAQGEIGMLRVAYCSAAMAVLLPQAIATARGRYPDLVLELRREDKSDQLAALAAGDLDLALTYRTFDETGRCARDVLSERVVAAIPAGHALAGATAIEPPQLAGEPLMRFASRSHEVLRTTADEVFAAAAVSPHYIADIADIETALGFATAGIGIVLINEQVAHMQRRPGISFVPLTSDVRLRIAAVWNEGAPTDAAVRRFVDIIIASATDDGAAVEHALSAMP
ncbi:MAG: LysR family transcriptional regulator [Candidatus Velthaea sp.]